MMDRGPRRQRNTSFKPWHVAGSKPKHRYIYVRQPPVEYTIDIPPENKAKKGE